MLPSAPASFPGARRSPLVLLIATVLLLMVPNCSWLGGRGAYPSARVDSVRFENVGVGSVTMLLGVRVENPYPFRIPVTGLDYALSSGTVRFLDGRLDLGETLPPDSTDALSIPIKIYYVDVVKALGRLPAGKDLALSADFYLHLRPRTGGDLRLPMSYRGTFPIPRGL